MLDNINKELDCIKNFLQKDVVFCIEQKTVRKGRLMLYNATDYYIKFTIKTNKDVCKTYEVPFPYIIKAYDCYINMSYKIIDLCAGNENKAAFIREHYKDSANKLHEKNLTISIIDT